MWQVRKRHLLHRVVEVVFAGHRASQNLSPGAILAPQQPTAGVCVCCGRAVRVDRRAESVLPVVEVPLLVEGDSARDMDATLGQEVSVCRVALGNGRYGELMRLVGLAGRAGDHSVGNRICILGQDPVFVKFLGERAPEHERHAHRVFVVARLYAMRVAHVAYSSALRTCGCRLDRHGRVSVCQPMRVARPCAPDERDSSVLYEIASLGADLVRIHGESAISGQRRVVIDSRHRRERLGLQPFKDIRAVEGACADAFKHLRRTLRAVALVERQNRPPLGVVGIEPPCAGVAAFKPDVSVALRIFVVRVVRGEGLVPVVVAPALFGMVGLAQHGVGERPEPARLGYRMREGRVVRVAQDAFLSLVPVLVDVACGDEFFGSLRYVVELCPVPVAVDVGVVAHRVAEAADLPKPDLRRRPVDVHYPPRMLQLARVRFGDRYLYSVGSWLY